MSGRRLWVHGFKVRIAGLRFIERHLALPPHEAVTATVTLALFGPVFPQAPCRHSGGRKAAYTCRWALQTVKFPRTMSGFGTGNRQTVSDNLGISLEPSKRVSDALAAQRSTPSIDSD